MIAADPLSRTAILELREVHLPAGGVDVDLVLAPGELVLIDAEVVEQEEVVVDVALGLVAPDAGEVRFRGHAWPELSGEFAAALRGRIGLIPRRGGWMGELSTLANVLLQSRFHQRTDAMMLVEAARRLATRFFLPGLPLDPVGAMHPRDRLRAACVRAFVAEPDLVVVETPLTAGWGSLLPPLVEAMQEVRDRGGAVLWFLTDDDLFDEPSLPADRRYYLRGRTLVSAIAP